MRLLAALVLLAGLSMAGVGTFNDPRPPAPENAAIVASTYELDILTGRATAEDTRTMIEYERSRRPDPELVARNDMMRLWGLALAGIGAILLAGAWIAGAIRPTAPSPQGSAGPTPRALHRGRI
jgi:hypothetical protein